MFLEMFQKWLKLRAGLLTALVVFVVALNIPSIEGRQVVTGDTLYWLTPGGSVSAIEDVVNMPSDRWTSVSRRPSANMLIAPDKAWTKLRIPAQKDGLRSELVAEVNFPMHRDIEFYVVQGKVVIASSVLSSIRPGPNESGSVFSFQASPTNALELYVHSSEVGLGLPKPKIMSREDYRDYRNTIDLLLGMIFGASLAILLYNLFVGVILKRVAHLYFFLFGTGTLGVASVTSGVAEYFFPRLRGDLDFYWLVYGQFIVLAVLGFYLFEHSFYGLSIINRNIKKGHWGLPVLACLMSCGLASVNPAHRPIILILLMAVAVGSSQYFVFRQPKMMVVREYSSGISIFNSALIVSLATGYELIEPSFVRTMMFQIGFIAGSLYFSSIVALRVKEIKIKKNQIIAAIKRDAEKIAVEGHLQQTVEHTLEEAEVAIMFVDIVAFSQFASPLPSSQVFGQLSSRLGEIAQIVRDFGGNIDRSLGDGLLCFFGYQSGDPPERNTQRAFLAARKIQEYTVNSSLSLIGRGKKPPIMPVRIGIHSSRLLMGNVGGGARVDFSIIGSGVNFANRLEAACSPFKLMLSQTCFEHLLLLGYTSTEFSEVAISVKHKTELMKSFEYDPFRDRIEDLHVVERAYFNNLGIQSRDQRYLVRERATVLLKFRDEEMKVVDFSRFGFRLYSKRQFGRQARLAVHVSISDDEVLNSLKSHYVDQLTIEVRWSRFNSGLSVFEHGVKIVGSSKQQRDFLFEILGNAYADLSYTDIDGLSQQVA